MSDTYLEDAKRILGDLIAFPSVSSRSNRDLIEYARSYLEELGASTRVIVAPDGTRANLFATLGPEIDGGIVLSGHSDVVPAEADDWTSDPFKMREADGLLYGRGACDMKGFIAACLAMAPHYASLDLKRPLHIALTYDEEIGCFGAQHLISELQTLGIRPSVAIVGEPTEMRVIEGHKGSFEYTTHFCGTDGHGSDPDKGVNAIHFAARYITKMLDLGAEVRARRHPSANRFDPPYTTVQVGTIEGGSARNVIAKNCSIDWEIRPVDPQDSEDIKRGLSDYCSDTLLPEMQKVYPDADIRMEIVGEVAGLQIADENEARDIVCALTGNDQCDVVAFGTEAGLFQEIGMSVVVCGPGSIVQAHKPDEFVSLDQMDQCLKMLERLSDHLT